MKSFLKKRKLSITFEKKKKRNKQRNRRNFAEILCFVNIVFIFQREFTENMRTIKKPNFHRICKRRERVDVQYKHGRKLQNIKKMTRNL